MKKNHHVAKIRSLDEHIKLAKRFHSGTSYNLSDKLPGFFNDYRHVRKHFNCGNFAELAGWASRRYASRMPKPTPTKNQTKVGSVIVSASIKAHYERLPKIEPFSSVDAKETLKLSQVSNTTNLMRIMVKLGLLVNVGEDQLLQRGRKRHLYKRSASWKFKSADTIGDWYLAYKS